MLHLQRNGTVLTTYLCLHFVSLFILMCRFRCCFHILESKFLSSFKPGLTVAISRAWKKPLTLPEGILLIRNTYFDCFVIAFAKFKKLAIIWTTNKLQKITIMLQVFLLKLEYCVYKYLKITQINMIWYYRITTNQSINYEIISTGNDYANKDVHWTKRHFMLYGRTKLFWLIHFMAVLNTMNL